ncbi:MAG: ABC transporter ATP-binding protein/permease [Candidatus Methanoplasma sp.]|jgi:ATP-binding cassette subfamily B protein|nr:ABC transporter ATP-binding protein/permease [Candidatus Methanoplasma sp.]
MSDGEQRHKRNPRGPMGGPMGMGAAEKPKEFKKTGKKLIQYSRVFVPSIIMAFAMAIGAAVLQILSPELLRNITNEIAKGVSPDGVNFFGAIDMSFVTTTAAILICFYAGFSALTFVQNWIMATVTQKMSKQMRSDISQKINRLPFSYFNKTSYGDVLSRVTNDVDTIGTTLNQSVSPLVGAVALFAGCLIMMFYTNWAMALTSVGASVLGFMLAAVIVLRSQKFFAAQQKDLGNINGHVEETYAGHNIVKIYNGSKGSKKAFEEINGRLYDSGWKSMFFTGLIMPLMMFISNFGYVAVCIVGAVLTMNGEIDYGAIVAFMLYVGFFSRSLSQFAQGASILQRTIAASERVFEFLEETELEDESGKARRLADVRGSVEFRNVRFGYTSDKVVINDFSAKVKAGQKIAIVGPTGAGKTTVVNLLMRFYELDAGEILLDGVPTSDVPRENVHEQFCMVLQDTWMFNGTIKENIIYSKQNVSDAEVVAACKAVGMDHFIQTLPDGYNTMMTDASSISEGQKQLLTIARAIIKDSPLLILDEATSSVDTRTERMVQRAMDALTVGRTSFIIAHRLSTIKNADVILVMRDGDVVESGTHAKLLEQRGFYAELYNSQFETAA